MIEEEVREKIDFIELIKIAKENKIIIIAMIIICFIIGMIYSNFIVKPEYKTTSTILIDQTSTAISDLISNSELIEKLADELNMDYLTIKKSIEVTYTKNAKTIQIYVNYGDSQTSYNIATKYMEILENYLKTYYEVESFEVVLEPEIATEANEVNTAINMIKYILFGMVISIVYIVVIKLKNGLTSGNEIEQTGIKFLGEIEEKERTVLNIELNNIARNPKLILITGITDKTDVALDIAKVYSNKNKKVLIIDGSFEEKIEYEEKIEIKTSEQLGIKKENLCDKETVDIIEKLKNKYDVILINANPIITEMTTTVWANISDIVILVIKYRKTKEKDIIKAKKYIKDINGKIAGAVLEK